MSRVRDIKHPGISKSREQLSIPRPEGEKGRCSYQNLERTARGGDAHKAL